MNLIVRSSVFDIRSIEPDSHDQYIVDTNAWYWMTYSNASVMSTPPTRAQSTYYPRYLKKAIEKGATLHRCDLSLAELSHSIEKCEKDIYVQYVIQGELTLKQYRHGDDEERKRTVTEIESAWSQVYSMSNCASITLAKPVTDAALEHIKSCNIDGYDAFLLEAMINSRITKIITDDCDFGTVSGIEIYTSNPNLIAEAEKQGKLVR